MEQSVQLVLDALREAGNNFGQPAFEAAVAYKVAEATLTLWLGVLVMALGLFPLGIAGMAIYLRLKEKEDGAGAFAFGSFGTATIVFIAGGLIIVSQLAIKWAPEGYLVMQMLDKIP